MSCTPLKLLEVVLKELAYAAGSMNIQEKGVKLAPVPATLLHRYAFVVGPLHSAGTDLPVEVSVTRSMVGPIRLLAWGSGCRQKNANCW